ncbi:MAG TPA: hypothetical protein VFD92_03810 [Candidatus Binatia bacterium]|nr:hypothetical protein [Candidatus Binatia bacterium]
MSPLGLLRQIRYDGVKDVALVQTGPADHLARVAAELARVFPGCALHVVVRERDGADRSALGSAFFEIARPGDRAGLAARLRRKRFDIVAIQLADEPLGELAPLALRLRGRSLVAFNRNLDHFPISLQRMTAIAQHLGARGSGMLSATVGLAARLALRVFGWLLGAAWLILVAGWIHARGLARRLRAREDEAALP